MAKTTWESIQPDLTEEAIRKIAYQRALADFRANHQG